MSFEVAPGEFFGVVGKNGSGKSTLLRCLAGIYPADSGQIAVEGRLVPFIELGVGFNKEMTARENVMINAVLFGLSRREAAARFDDIVAFAELERFVDQKLKNYSTRHGGEARVLDHRPRRRRRLPLSTRFSPSATPPSRRSASGTSTGSARRGRRS